MTLWPFPDSVYHAKHSYDSHTKQYNLCNYKINIESARKVVTTYDILWKDHNRDTNPNIYNKRVDNFFNIKHKSKRFIYFLLKQTNSAGEFSSNHE